MVSGDQEAEAEEEEEDQSEDALRKQPSEVEPSEVEPSEEEPSQIHFHDVEEEAEKMEQEKEEEKEAPLMQDQQQEEEIPVQAQEDLRQFEPTDQHQFFHEDQPMEENWEDQEQQVEQPEPAVFESSAAPPTMEDEAELHPFSAEPHPEQVVGEKGEFMAEPQPVADNPFDIYPVEERNQLAARVASMKARFNALRQRHNSYSVYPSCVAEGAAMSHCLHLMSQARIQMQQQMQQQQQQQQPFHLLGNEGEDADWDAACSDTVKRFSECMALTRIKTLKSS